MNLKWNQFNLKKEMRRFMKKLFLVFLPIALGLTGCASFQSHEHALNSIVALDSPTEGHVCMSASKVNQGEQLSLFQNVCTTKIRKLSKFSEPTDTTTCVNVARGFVEVTENSDTHFIKIKALDGAALETGFLVEKTVE